jgi:hypothetical protein
MIDNVQLKVVDLNTHMYKCWQEIDCKKFPGRLICGGY